MSAAAAATTRETRTSPGFRSDKDCGFVSFGTGSVWAGLTIGAVSFRTSPADCSPVLKLLCTWMQEHGHHCETALLAACRTPTTRSVAFIHKHRPDVVIYDVGMPYSSSWDLPNRWHTFWNAGDQPARILEIVL